jgi:hypothetical protein
VKAKHLDWLCWAALGWSIAATSCPALAGGAHSDEERQQEFGFFGFVRDTRGNAVVEAKVTADFTTRKIKLIARSDATGAYGITRLGDNTDPKTVTITCAKDGYRMDKAVPRDLDPKVGQPVEVDCILAKL